MMLTYFRGEKIYKFSFSLEYIQNIYERNLVLKIMENIYEKATMSASLLLSTFDVIDNLVNKNYDMQKKIERYYQQHTSFT